MTPIGMPRPYSPTAGTTAAKLPLLLGLLGRVPLGIARAIGASLGVLCWICSPGYRRKLQKNLEIAGYGKGQVRRQAIVQTGRLIAESPYIWAHTPRQIGELIQVNCSPEHAAQIAEAESKGNGVIILTPHLGAFEVAARYYATHRSITVLFKPAKLKWVNKWLVAARGVDGVDAVPTTVGGLRSMLRTLRRGDIVGLLPDQVPTDGDGEWSTFFGEPAYTMTLPQRLVEMTGCAVVLCVGERLPGARGWRMRFEPMTELPTPDAVNKRFETLIRAMPGQYLWGYNRYKHPPGGTPESTPPAASPMASNLNSCQ